MIPRTLLAPALAALLLAAAAALAQPEADAGAAPPPPPKAGNGAEPKVSAPAGANSKPAQAEKSPSDYRASEQISEDLPVSFPVDI